MSLDSRRDIYQRRTRFDIRHAVEILLVVYFFFPALDELIHPAAGIIHQLIVLLLLVWIVVVLGAFPVSTIRRMGLVLLIMSFYSAHVFIGSLSVVGARQLTIPDLYEVHRPIMISMALITAAAYASRSPRDWSKINRIFLILSLVIVFLGLVQYFRLLPDSALLQYTKFRMIRRQQISVPWRNPYDYAYVMIFFASLQLSRSILLRHRSSVALACVAYLLAGGVIVFSQARSGILAFAFASFVVLAMSWLQRRNGVVHRWRVVQLVMVAVIAIAAVSQIAGALVADSLYYVAEAASHISEAESPITGLLTAFGTERIAQLHFAWDSIARSVFTVVFGHGPHKALGIHLESIYASIGYRYGLLGITLYIVFPVMLALRAGWIALSRVRSIEKLAFCIAATAWVISILVAGLANNFLEQARVFVFFYFVLGMLLVSCCDRDRIDSRGTDTVSDS